VQLKACALLGHHRCEKQISYCL